MIAEKALRAFQTGKYGEVIPVEFLQNLEKNRAEIDADYAGASLVFDQGAKPGDSIITIEVSVRIKPEVIESVEAEET